MTANALDLGISQEELREQVIERAAQKVADHVREGGYNNLMREVVLETAMEVAHKIADEEIRPWAEGQIESLTLQRTNEWGEKKGEAVTFRQYLIKMAESYMEEPVDRDGNSRKENRYGGTFSAVQTRLAHMIDKNLHFHIKGAIESALKNANSRIADGIAETAKMRLREVSESLKVDVKTR